MGQALLAELNINVNQQPFICLSPNVQAHRSTLIPPPVYRTTDDQSRHQTMITGPLMHRCIFVARPSDFAPKIDRQNQFAVRRISVRDVLSCVNWSNIHISLPRVNLFCICTYLPSRVYVIYYLPLLDGLKRTGKQYNYLVSRYQDNITSEIFNYLMDSSAVESSRKHKKTQPTNRQQQNTIE